MANVLLTGASGFVGGHLLRELLANGHRVQALSRGAASDAVLADAGAVPVRGSLGDQAALNAAAQGVHAVFHCAANTSAWSRDREVQNDTNIEGTRRLLAAAEANGVECFVHTSSVSAYSHLVEEVLTETLPQRGGESWINYERSKFLGEQAVRQSALPYLVFNPSHVLGPGDRNNWARLVKMVHDGTLPGVPPGSGAFADVREIAKAQVKAWQSGLRNESFLLGGSHASFLEFVQLAAQLSGRPPARRAMPQALLRVVGQLSEMAAAVTGKMPQITPAAVAMTCHHLKVNSAKAMAQLGYRETPLPQLMADTLAWMRAEGMITASPV
ncbi:NAD-dependent epimerase/dehydratase family protein [Arenimonas sp. GDDSR-1]|uniref:NAD-dependent epimerase/dehydratase family protein n=1 Tax=Arenimonas sp. GDDSR-1 TaxID=2950125 RepID=UPI002620D45E|nr:NAD-dependent epimerase/dehydratase family protein [Arenimonas sp. GDDSR-1]